MTIPIQFANFNIIICQSLKSCHTYHHAYHNSHINNPIHVLQMIQHNLSRLGDIQLYIFNQLCNLTLDKLTIQTNHLSFDISHTYPYQIPNRQYINSINLGTICSNSNNSNNSNNANISSNFKQFKFKFINSTNFAI